MSDIEVEVESIVVNSTSDVTVVESTVDQIVVVEVNQGLQGPQGESGSGSYPYEVAVDGFVLFDVSGELIDPRGPNPLAPDYFIAFIDQSEEDIDGIWEGQTPPESLGDPDEWLSCLRTADLPTVEGSTIVTQTRARDLDELYSGGQRGPFTYRLENGVWVDVTVPSWPDPHGMFAPAQIAVVGTTGSYRTPDVGPLDADGFSVVYQAIVFSPEPDHVGQDEASFCEVLTKFADDDWMGDQDLLEEALYVQSGALGVFSEMVREGDPVPVEAGEWALGRFYSLESGLDVLPFGGLITVRHEVLYDDGNGNTVQNWYYRTNILGYDYTTGGWSEAPDETLYWRLIHTKTTPGVIQLMDTDTVWRVGTNAALFGVSRVEVYRGIDDPELVLHFNAADIQGDGTIASSQIPGHIWEPEDDPMVIDTDPRVTLDTSDFVLASEVGAANGVAELDGDGKIPASQLPSYVDDVREVANFAALSGEIALTGRIYVTLDDGKTYRWSGSAYVEISASLALGETSGTAYRGDRGKTAYDHSQITTGNPHGTTAADVGAASTAYVDAAVDDLSGVSNPSTARTNLGLGGAAVLNVGTTAGTVAAGDDSRLSLMPRVTVSLISGQGVSNMGTSSNSTSHGLQAANRRTWVPLYLPADTYTRVGIIVTTGAVSTWRIGLHAFDSTGWPVVAPMHDFGTVDCSGAIGRRDITISQAIAAGWYWAQIQVDSYTATPNVNCISGLGPYAFMPLGFTTDIASSNRSRNSFYDSGGTGGALGNAPANWAAGAIANNDAVRVWFWKA